MSSDFGIKTDLKRVSKFMGSNHDSASLPSLPTNISEEKELAMKVVNQTIKGPLPWTASCHLFSAKKSTAKPNKCNASVTLEKVNRSVFSLAVFLRIQFDLT